MPDQQEHRAFIDAAIQPGLTFSIVETAKILRRTPNWVTDLLDNGRIPSITIGRRRVVTRATLVDVLSRGT
jgi:hypothetical protein